LEVAAAPYYAFSVNDTGDPSGDQAQSRRPAESYEQPGVLVAEQSERQSVLLMKPGGRVDGIRAAPRHLSTGIAELPVTVTNRAGSSEADMTAPSRAMQH